MVCKKQEKSMSSRSAILQAVKQNQPTVETLPDITQPDYALKFGTTEKFAEVLTAIGGRVILVDETDDLKALILQVYGEEADIVSVIDELPFKPLFPPGTEDPHVLENVDIALMKAQFGVSENGSVWVTEAEYKVRAFPFICQHLAVVLSRNDLVPYMHEAYQKISGQQYGFGLFIAGPSKTADIEQSLVLGAHGPKTMTVFLTQ